MQATKVNIEKLTKLYKILPFNSTNSQKDSKRALAVCSVLITFLGTCVISVFTSGACNKYIGKQKWHTLLCKNNRKNLFSQKSAENRNIQLWPEKQELFLSKECT